MQVLCSPAPRSCSLGEKLKRHSQISLRAWQLTSVSCSTSSSAVLAAHSSSGSSSRNHQTSTNPPRTSRWPFASAAHNARVRTGVWDWGIHGSGPARERDRSPRPSTTTHQTGGLRALRTITRHVLRRRWKIVSPCRSYPLLHGEWNGTAGAAGKRPLRRCGHRPAEPIDRAYLLCRPLALPASRTCSLVSRHATVKAPGVVAVISGQPVCVCVCFPRDLPRY